MKNYRVPVILFLFVFAWSAPRTLIFAQKKISASQKVFYVLNITKAEDVIATVLVNDVPLVTTDEQGYSGFKDINVWVVPGKNTVSVKLSAAKKLPSAPFSAENAGITLSVSEALFGQMSDEGKPVLKFEWPAKQKLQLPFETYLSFTANTPPPSDFWKTAKEITLDDGAKKEIFALVSELNTAFTKRDYNKVGGLLLYRDKEMDKARYQTDKTDDKRKESIVKDYKKFITDKADVSPLSFDGLEFELAAGKRVVGVTRKGGEPAIKITDGDAVLEFPVYAAPVNGKWTFAR